MKLIVWLRGWNNNLTRFSQQQFPYFRHCIYLQTLDHWRWKLHLTSNTSNQNLHKEMFERMGFGMAGMDAPLWWPVLGSSGLFDLIIFDSWEVRGGDHRAMLAEKHCDSVGSKADSERNCEILLFNA